MDELIAPGVLIPPAPLRLRVAGTDHLEWFHVSGRMTCDVYQASLAAVGRELREFHDILDFGCGVGRVLRWLRPLMPQARLAGSEIDANSISWVRDNYPDVDMAGTGADGLPPLRFEDGRFDLVLGYSVFTHLNVAYQDAWLKELRRLVRRDGLLLLSINGPRMLDHVLTKSGHGNLPDLQARLRHLESEGILHWRGDGSAPHFPDYYHTTFHTHRYIVDHWSRWFDVLGIYADAPPEMPQDIVILRRG
jgi:SAM-dependent methyltransferase